MMVGFATAARRLVLVGTVLALAFGAPPHAAAATPAEIDAKGIISGGIPGQPRIRGPGTGRLDLNGDTSGTFTAEMDDSQVVIDVRGTFDTTPRGRLLFTVDRDALAQELEDLFEFVFDQFFAQRLPSPEWSIHVPAAVVRLTGVRGRSVPRLTLGMRFVATAVGSNGRRRRVSAVLSFRGRAIPDVALITASGHGFGRPRAYLGRGGGAALEQDLRAAGYVVSSLHFPDRNGIDRRIARALDSIHQKWIADADEPVTVVVLAHSHGGVRAHEAIESRPAIPVGALIDLDTNGCGFPVTHARSVPTFTIGTETVGVQDVVFDNVTHNFEARTGDDCPVTGTDYDARSNARLSGSTTGITTVDVLEGHGELDEADSQTMADVMVWLRARLLGLR